LWRAFETIIEVFEIIIEVKDKEVSFNTSQSICHVMSLLALRLGTYAIEMPAQQISLNY